MKTSDEQVSLLDVLAYKMHCDYLSDLRFLGSLERLTLVQMICGIPAENAELLEWNDALDYLANEPKVTDRAEAKNRLVDALSTLAHKTVASS